MNTTTPRRRQTILLVLVFAAGLGADVQCPGAVDAKGKPFLELQAQIDALEAEVEALTVLVRQQQDVLQFVRVELETVNELRDPTG